MDELVFTVYAESLFAVAKEENGIEDVKREFDLFENALSENRAYIDFLSLPTIPAPEKTELIEAFSFGSLFSNFLKVLLENKRFDAILGIKKEFDRYYDGHKGIERAVVYTAKELSEEGIAKIKQGLSKAYGKMISVTQKLDPSLIGGVKVVMNDKVIDASIRSKLSELHLSMSNMSNTIEENYESKTGRN